MKLYYHKTTGGAEYLYDTYINWKNKGKKGKEGRITDKTKYVVRIDGDITKDAELTIRNEHDGACETCVSCMDHLQDNKHEYSN